uniref:Uncharacterized protein n=1 Tax=Oryza nivara TaxID=4536 RepID=A0A0E0IBW0_ORYNI
MRLQVWALAGGEGSVLSIGRGWGRRDARIWVMKAGVATATRAHGRWRSSVFPGENPRERLEVRLGVARALARRGTEGTTRARAWVRRDATHGAGTARYNAMRLRSGKCGLGSDAAEGKEAWLRCGTGVAGAAGSDVVHAVDGIERLADSE